MTGLPSVGLISHGTSSPTGQVLIEVLAAEVATDLRIRGLAGEVMLGHVDVQAPDVDEVIARLPADRPVVLVPLLLSPGYHVHVDLAEAVSRAEAAGRDVRLAPTLGPDPRLAAILADRLPPLREGDDVILAAAGSSDERANESCREVGRLLAAELERPVEVGFLAGGGVPLKDIVEESRSRGAQPVLANYLLAPGFFDDLARKLVAAGGSDSSGVLAPPLLSGGGRSAAVPYRLVDIVRDRVREGIHGCDRVHEGVNARGQVREGVHACGHDGDPNGTHTQVGVRACCHDGNLGGTRTDSGAHGPHAQDGAHEYARAHAHDTAHAHDAAHPHGSAPQMLNA